MPEEIHGQRLAAVEAALTALAPLPAHIDRDHLMYRAGQSAALGPGWMWRGVSAGLATLSVALGAALVMRPSQPPVERTVYVQPHAPPPAAPPVSRPPAPQDTGTAAAAEEPDSLPAPTERLALQKQVLRWGLDGLPNPPSTAPAEQPLTVDGLLGAPPSASDSPAFFRLDSLIHFGDKS
ncbi:MAG TPA: hypothetical protein VG013_21795 [Gemmataceae bacterium]|jgi:hypothetical protein|nr:hypothetical protein [Gemmataceae bacterium]